MKTAWQRLMRARLPWFLAFFFSALYRGVDWSRGFRLVTLTDGDLLVMVRHRRLGACLLAPGVRVGEGRFSVYVSMCPLAPVVPGRKPSWAVWRQSAPARSTRGRGFFALALRIQLTAVQAAGGDGLIWIGRSRLWAEITGGQWTEAQQASLVAFMEEVLPLSEPVAADWWMGVSARRARI